MGFLHGLLHRENKWLIGVYKGRLITVSNWEKNNIWEHLKEIRSTGLFKTHVKREKLEPCFFLLEPADYLITIEYGDKKFLENYGLKLVAYKYGHAPIPAYGHVKKDRFILNERIVREYEKTHNLSLRTLLTGRPCVLALKVRGYDVRTGTFFMQELEDKKIVFIPCKYNNKKYETYVVGKGVLADILDGRGYMTISELSMEKKCPVSMLGVGFKDTDHKYYTIYREVSTDLRADMPLAMLKIAPIKNVFENMFRRLGESIKLSLTRHLSNLCARNVLLDGTIVDYADQSYIDITDPKYHSKLVSVKEEIRSMMFSAALISVARKEALLKMRGGAKGLAKLIKKHEKGIFERYESFFKCFEEGLGDEKIRDKKITEYFEEIAGREGLQNFLDELLKKSKN